VGPRAGLGAMARREKSLTLVELGTPVLQPVA